MNHTLIKDSTEDSKRGRKVVIVVVIVAAAIDIPSHEQYAFSLSKSFYP